MILRLAALILAWVSFAGFVPLQAQEAPAQVAKPQTALGVQQGAPATNQMPGAAFQLKPTAIAPAEAAGHAELKNGKLTLHLSHLNPDNYVVEGLGKPDLARYRLGVIVISDPTASPGRQANDNKREASAHPETAHLEVDVQMDLPAEFRSLRIERLRLLGSSGNAVLEGVAK